MSTLKRRQDVSPEKFKEEWFDVHSVLVKRLPQVKAYTQNLILINAAAVPEAHPNRTRPPGK